MPLASGAYGYNAYTAEDVALTKEILDNAKKNGAAQAQYHASGSTAQASFEKAAAPSIGSSLSIYDPILAALLAGEVAI